MKAKMPTLKELNCANHDEVYQRCLFQNWVTDHLGYLSVEERDKLWARFKNGGRFTVSGKRIRPRLTITEKAA